VPCWVSIPTRVLPDEVRNSGCSGLAPFLTRRRALSIHPLTHPSSIECVRSSPHPTCGDGGGRAAAGQRQGSGRAAAGQRQGLQLIVKPTCTHPSLPHRTNVWKIGGSGLPEPAQGHRSKAPQRQLPPTHAGTDGTQANVLIYLGTRMYMHLHPPMLPMLLVSCT
jgi:hypothetical protein